MSVDTQIDTQNYLYNGLIPVCIYLHVQGYVCVCVGGGGGDC